MALDTVSSHKKEPVTFSTVESHWTQVVSSQSSKDIIAYLFILDNFLARLNVTSSFALDADSEYTTDALCDKITKLLYGPDGELIEPSLLTTEDIANA